MLITAIKPNPDKVASKAPLAEQAENAELNQRLQVLMNNPGYL
jgi:hypothetical protein